MSPARRPQLAQRRRRVIYSQQLGGDDSVAGASRAARLRAARRPTAAYGSRVHRRLRARWFGLVPVRRRAMGLLAAVATVVTAVLMLGHWLALTWPALASRPELARPLRLDRPDSFGTWLSVLLLAASSATALLIYQLRRHRADDYKGHYRLWRPAILLLLLASVDCLVGLADWTGAVLDAALGERTALAGADWVRLLLAVGGVSFGLRMIVEARRSTAAVVGLTVALLAFAFPAAVRWRIVSVQSQVGWMMLAAAPLIGRGCLWLGLVAYLRVLYREVRRIDHDEAPWRDRLRPWRMRSAAAETDRQAAEKMPAGRAKAAAADSRRATRQTPRSAPESADPPQRSPGRSPKRSLGRWLRRCWPLPRSAADAADRPAPPNADPVAEPKPPEPKPPASKRPESKPPETNASAAGKPPRRSWLRRFLLRLRGGRSSAAATDPAGEGPQAAGDRGRSKPPLRADRAPTARPAAGLPSTAAAGPQPYRDDPQDDGDEADDSDSIGDGDDSGSVDWATMSKAERRRLKRQLKRDGRAA